MESFLPHEDCETGTCWRWWEDAPFDLSAMPIQYADPARAAYPEVPCVP